MFKKIIILFVLTISLAGCDIFEGGGSTADSTSEDSTSGDGGSSGDGSSGDGSSGDGSSGDGSSGDGSSGDGSSGDGSSGDGSSGDGSSGDGSSGDGSSGDGSSGDGMTGNCVTYPRPVVGQVQKQEVKDVGNASTAVITSTITAFSDTSISFDKVSTGDFSATGDTTQTFTIANNFMDITKIVSDDVTTTTVPGVVDITSTTSTTIDFQPMLRVPADEVCENQTWTSTYDLNTDVSVVTSLVSTPTTVTNTSSQSIIFTIEAINESKTVKAGTFNTFRMKREDGTDVETHWIDIATGKTVSQESRDNSNTIIGTVELLP